ncbi:hypothetical protein D3C86_1362750 [compost metagenome]
MLLLTSYSLPALGEIASTTKFWWVSPWVSSGRMRITLALNVLKALWGGTALASSTADELAVERFETVAGALQPASATMAAKIAAERQTC